MGSCRAEGKRKAKKFKEGEGSKQRGRQLWNSEGALNKSGGGWLDWTERTRRRGACQTKGEYRQGSINHVPERFIPKNWVLLDADFKKGHFLRVIFPSHSLHETLHAPKDSSNWQGIPEMTRSAPRHRPGPSHHLTVLGGMCSRRL